VSTLQAISRRLNRLEMERVFTGNIEPIREAIMNRRLVVVQGPVWFLQVLGAYVIRKFYRERRQYQDAGQTGEEVPKFPPFLVVTDEAHNFAPRSPEIPAPARSILRTIAQEGRKYGVFLILATQRPALLDDTITAQLNTKLIFRTVRSSDLEVIREETDLGPEEVRRLPYLTSGNAFVSSATHGRTIAVRIRAAKTVSPHSRHPFAELAEDFVPEEERLRELLLQYLPLGDFNFDVHLSALQQELKRRVTIDEITRVLEDLVEEGVVEKKEMVLGVEYRKAGNG
ncbi:MAG: ATP-binding protein, partial [bacterium]